MHPTAPLQRALRRLPLTTKQGPHNFYKGNRTGAMGRHTKYGGYVIEWDKVRTYVCPDLTGFKLTPFVARKIERIKFNNKITGQEYLQRWKDEGGDV